jgi:gas vesicle protein
MSDNSESSRVGGYLAAFAIGALIGTGAALLYAPRSGKETRELIAKKGRALKGQAADAIEDAKDFIDGKKAELAAAIEAGKDAMREERAKHQKAA